MGLRESATRNPRVTGGIAVGLIAIALAVAVYNLLPDRPASLDKAFFSDDDGKTWYTDSSSLVPPFDHGGKTAVRAQLFTCSDRKTPFVGYVERYTPEMKRKLDESAARVASGKPPSVTMDSQAASWGGLEFKKPGEANWTSGADLKAKQKLFVSLCPSGGVDSYLP